MARSLRSFLTSASNFLSKLTGKKPKPPVVQRRTYQTARGQTVEVPGGGHRGVGIGDTNKPDLSMENIQKWRGLGIDELEDFVFNGQIMFVHSTNVAAAQYFIETNQLMVEFLGKKGKANSAYLYNNIGVEDAVSFAKAESKGIWVWSWLRIKGSRTAHRVPFVRLR